MAHKMKVTVGDVVLLDSDSDEDDGVRGETFQSSLSPLEITHQQVPSTITDTTVTPLETLECRSFWKAGENFVITKDVTQTAPGMLEHARVHPKFLHSNATSHKWAFGAIAELVDNAVDEIQNGATFVKIDKIDIVKDNSPALVFQDDGAGMDPDGIRKCMSLGYSSKKSNTTIGQYGNGFKTSTMRLGADAIVFTRSTRGGKTTQSVGLLSYTFLRRTGQDDVIVPMIDIDISEDGFQPIVYGSSEDWSTNLNILLKWSPFSTEDELLQQFKDIGTHGTKVIIYNLWLNDEGIYELSFDDDDEDIRLRDEGVQDGKRMNSRALELRSHISYRVRHSLRAYTSMLYLKKFENFKIILRGVPVVQFNIADEFRYPETIMYKPQAAAMEYAAAEIKVGFIKEAPKLPVSGFNVYHKNRLIQPFWNVNGSGSSSKGSGVVGVLEANFIEPAHDKQDFERKTGTDTVTFSDTIIIKRLQIGRKGQVGPVIREISLSKGTSSCTVAVPPPHMRSSTGVRSNFQPVQLNPQPVDTDTSRSNLVGKSEDEINEENMQLIMRCEEYIKKETEMERTVKNLEKELEEAKSKCAQLALLVDARGRRCSKFS
ncbi:hypothetical protein Bca101_015580 [Brassica carinata]